MAVQMATSPLLGGLILATYRLPKSNRYLHWRTALTFTDWQSWTVSYPSSPNYSGTPSHDVDGQKPSGLRLEWVPRCWVYELRYPLRGFANLSRPRLMALLP